MSFKDGDWATREKSLGDQAEQRFRDWADRKGLGFTDYGLRRPPIQLHKVAHRIRFTPDFLLSNQLVEAQGFGRDQMAKLKTSKWGALHFWNDLHPLYLYWWDSHYERECFMHLLEFDALLPHATMGAFDNGRNPYFSISADLIFAHGTDSP